MPEHPIFRKARESSKGGYVQHVNSNSESDDKEHLSQSDWTAGADTLVSYHGGKEIHRNYSHPLLRRYESAMNRQEVESDKERADA